MATLSYGADGGRTAYGGDTAYGGSTAYGEKHCLRLRDQEHPTDNSPHAAHADAAYPTEADAFLQIQRLLLFMNLRNDDDHRRLTRYCNRAMKSEFTGGAWPMAYLRLERAVLGTLNRQVKAIFESADKTDRTGQRGQSTASSVLQAPDSPALDVAAAGAVRDVWALPPHPSPPPPQNPSTPTMDPHK
ncbi:ubiquitin-protein ligase (E3) [Diplodia seriata]|uniref:Ubiquitin-protein ligase (E3) n=1 Tax=Diplodia seriata TaxID=420778 RepID=A0ABR3CQ22_9PEZI